MLLPPTCIATYPTSHHRQRCQHDCLLCRRLDYANALLYGASSKNINRLQLIQNALARCVLDSKAHRSSDALLHQLHWLPIRYRIDFKLAKLTFLARLSSTSSYLNSSVARYLPSRTLRSQDTNLLAVPRTKTVFGSHAFRVAAPTVFNSLPPDIRSTDNIYAFLPPFKDVLLPQCFQSTLATSSAPQIQHICWHCARKEIIITVTITTIILSSNNKLMPWAVLSPWRAPCQTHWGPSVTFLCNTGYNVQAYLNIWLNW